LALATTAGLGQRTSLRWRSSKLDLALPTPKSREGTEVLASFASGIETLAAHSVSSPAQSNQTQKGEN